MKKIFAHGFFALVLFMLGAQQAMAQFRGTQELIRGVKGIVDLLIPLVVALALLYFFWGLAKFIRSAGNEDARDEGKQIMLWGIVALFVIVSVWGIVQFLQRELLPGFSGGSFPTGQLPPLHCPPGTATC